MKTLILALLVIAFSFSSFAQSMHLAEKMNSELNLTAEQKERMRDIKDNYRSTLQTIHRSDASKGEKKSGKDALHEAMNQDVRDALSEEQFDQWLVIQEKKEAKRSKERQVRKVAKRELNLSDDQTSALQQIKSDKIQAMRELKNQNLESDERRAKMDVIHANSESQAQLVLTPDQFEKWKELKMTKGPRSKRQK